MMDRVLVRKVHRKLKRKYLHLSMEQISDVLDVTLGVVSSDLAISGRSQIRLFGTFVLKSTKSRKLWDINKGRKVMVQGNDNLITFRPSGNLKEIIRSLKKEVRHG